MSRYISIIIGLFLLSSTACASEQNITLSQKEIQLISEKVFDNECAGKDECLLEWNDGEEFMSLGIGHFIWYPQGQAGPFEESFPKFVEYLKSTGQKIPGWLNTNSVPKCPWVSKNEFLKNGQSPKVIQLRKLLADTKSKQGDFLIKRLNDALPLMLKSAPKTNRRKIRENFYLLTDSVEGIYALVDYINFKGLGTSSTERYGGKGWGLLQVLSSMKEQNESRKALEEFVHIANQVLIERVKNAPPARNEERWLPGWQRRIKSYLEFEKES